MTTTTETMDGDGDGDGDGGDMSRTIRMGILMGVTGGLENLGPPIRDAAQLAAQYMNEESDTFEIDARFEDTQTNPTNGISAAESLVNAGYPMIAGALSSEVTIQVANSVTIPNEIVQCSPASTSPTISTLEDNDFIYRTPPTDALQGQVMAQVAQERMGSSTTATLFLNNDYGQLLAEEYAGAFRNMGGTVQAEVSFEPERNSYTSELSQALADQPDVLMIVGYPASGNQIFRDFYSDFGTEFADILVPDGLKDPDLPGDVGNDMANVMGTAPLAAGPGRDFFSSMYQDEYGSEPGVFTSQSFDAAAILCLANAAAGENDGAAVRDEMSNVANPEGTEVTPENLAEGLEMAASGEEINYQGASSATDFDENGDMKAVTYELFAYGSDGLTQEDTISFTA